MDVVAAARRVMAEFTMPSLGADMDEGTLHEWRGTGYPRLATIGDTLDFRTGEQG